MEKIWRQTGELIVISGGIFLIILWLAYILPIFPNNKYLNNMLFSPILFGILGTVAGFLMMKNKPGAYIFAYISGSMTLIMTLVLYFRVQFYGELLELVPLGYYLIWTGAIVMIFGSVISVIKSDVGRKVLLFLSLVFGSIVTAVVLIILVAFSIF